MPFKWQICSLFLTLIGRVWISNLWLVLRNCIESARKFSLGLSTTWIYIKKRVVANKKKKWSALLFVTNLRLRRVWFVLISRLEKIFDFWARMFHLSFRQKSNVGFLRKWTKNAFAQRWLDVSVCLVRVRDQHNYRVGTYNHLRRKYHFCL